MSSKSKRVALYMRVSTEEQARHGDSIEAQRQALRQYADTHNLTVIGEYADEGISGQKPVRKRPALSQMLREVETGRVDLILFTKLDRWFRSVKLYYQAQEVLDAHKVAWRAILENYNTETADGGHFRAVVEVAPSPPFFAWVFTFGGRIQITGPDNVLQEMREMAAWLK